MNGLQLKYGKTAAAAVLILSPSCVNAGELAVDLIAAGMSKQCAPFAEAVSKREGNFGQVNQFGCLGAFQFCPGTFERYYAGSADQFLSDYTGQVTSWTNFEMDQWALAQQNGLTSLIDQVIDFPGHPHTSVSASSILMACQFGCGKHGKLANYMKSRDCGAANVKDGNKVSVCDYLALGAGKDVSCFINVGGVVPAPPPITDSSTTPRPQPSPMRNGSDVGERPPAPLVIKQDRPATPVGSHASSFGAEGPIEIENGKYILRFGSSLSPETLQRTLDVLDKR